jgi:hypothetical protein
MFISNTEKKHLLDRVKVLDALIKDMSLMASKITSLTAKVLILEQELVKPKKVKKPLTAAQKAKQREYQKAYNERQKIKKLEAELAKIGNTNVSA